MKRITPCLWFDKQAEEAANFYVSLFPNSKITNISHYGKEGFEVHQMPEGRVLVAQFELNGQEFMALNAGPVFKFTEAVSFVVSCENQEEVDRFWNALSAVKESEQCGWLKDKYGLSWQIIPKQLDEMISDPDPVKSGRVMTAMLQMKKIDIAALKKAYEG